jgi:hypothetical protein
MDKTDILYVNSESFSFFPEKVPFFDRPFPSTGYAGPAEAAATIVLYPAAVSVN